MTIKTRVALLMTFVSISTSFSLWGFYHGYNRLERIYQRRSTGNTLVHLSEEISLSQWVLLGTDGEKHTALVYLANDVFIMQSAIELILPEEEDGEIISALEDLLIDLSSVAIIMEDITLRLGHRDIESEMLYT